MTSCSRDAPVPPRRGSDPWVIWASGHLPSPHLDPVKETRAPRYVPTGERTSTSQMLGGDVYEGGGGGGACDVLHSLAGS